MATTRKDGRTKATGRTHAPSNLSAAAVEFEQRADQILAGYQARKAAGKASSPFESKEAYLKREAYVLIREYLSAPGRSRTIKTLVKRWLREPRSPSFRESPFFWGLIAIDPQADILNPARLHLYGQQLLYAHRHSVPAHFLVGFLYQSGNPGDLSYKVSRNVREDWFTQLSS